MPCTRARDRAGVDTGIDASRSFTERARLRAEELGVADRVEFSQGDAAGSISDFPSLPGLLASFGRLGYDLVEMVLAGEDSWDGSEAAEWLGMRRRLGADFDDELAGDGRAEPASEPRGGAARRRQNLGWAVSARMGR